MTGDFAPPPGPGGGQPDRPVGGSTPLPSRRPLGAPADSTPPNALRAGRGVRVAAWVSIGAGVALLIGISWSAALAWSDRATDSAEIGTTGDLHPLQVVPGMCLEDVADDGSISTASVVACDEPHRAEVFTSVIFSVAKYPGDAEMRDEVLTMCGDRLDGLLPDEASWVAWAPSEESWSRGDRMAMCVATFNDAKGEPLSPAGIKALDDEKPKGDGQGA